MQDRGIISIENAVHCELTAMAKNGGIARGAFAWCRLYQASMDNWMAIGHAVASNLSERTDDDYNLIDKYR